LKTLLNGQVDVHEQCLQEGRLYTLVVGVTEDTNAQDPVVEEDLAEVIWVACGYVGGAPATYKFTMNAYGNGGCEFTQVAAEDEIWYYNKADDDFPEGAFMPDESKLTASPTPAPSLSPGESMPTPLPTLVPTQAPVWAQPTVSPTPLPTTVDEVGDTIVAVLHVDVELKARETDADNDPNR